MTQPVDCTPSRSDLDGSDPQQLFIGTYTESASGETYDLVDPSTGEAMCQVYRAGTEDADRAMETAAETFENDELASLGPTELERCLFELVSLLEDHREELKHLVTWDTGKPLTEAKWEVQSVIERVRYHAGIPRKIEGETIPMDGARLDYTRREPYGVSLVVVPWNYPLGIATRDIAPSLACGNTVVVKPPTETPLAVTKFAELAIEAGLPEGSINVLPGDAEVGAHLVSHDLTDVVSFTGSVASGKKVAQTASENLIPAHLELGGKSPNIVFPDADIGSAVRNAIAGIFVNAGQMCVAGSRLLLHEAVYDEFMEQLVSATEDMTVGDPYDEDTDMGPVVSQQQYDRVMEYIERGKEEASLATGGTAADGGDGYFVEPTIFDDVSNDMAIAEEEIFGPVLSVLTFEGEDEAVEIANDTDYGLHAAVWTADVGVAHRMIENLEAGTVAVNQFHAQYAQSPFGGYKQSGLGRANGMQSVEQYTQVKNAVVNYYG